MTDVQTELAAGNTLVDDAARAAGRDPRDVRRIFDFRGSFGVGGGFARGRTEQWVDQLLPLAVGPALREAVARERRGYESARLAS